MDSKPFMLVDNNPATRKELIDLLSYLGFKDIHAFESATEAWAMLRMRKFDWIFSEWELPEMSGLSFLKVVRNEDRFIKTPFFLIHSAFTKIKVVQAGQAGVTGLIVKPYDQGYLSRRMSDIVEIPGDPPKSEAEVKIEEAMDLVEKEDYQSALSVFHQLISKNETAEYYYNLGYIKTAKGEYPEAIDMFQKATALDRLYAKAFEGMARAYGALGNNEMAEKCFRKAADIHIAREDDQEAENVLQEILKISKDTKNVFNSMGVLYRKRGDFEAALDYYKRAIRVHPGEPHIHYNIGRAYLDLHQRESAIRHFAKAVKLDPGFREASEVLAAIKKGAV